jgi:hypothetical protein
MKAMKEFFWFMLDGKKSNLILAIVVLAAAVLLCSLANAHPEWLRHLYCTANEAQAIECTAKGWW